MCGGYYELHTLYGGYNFVLRMNGATHFCMGLQQAIHFGMVERSYALLYGRYRELQTCMGTTHFCTGATGSYMAATARYILCIGLQGYTLSYAWGLHGATHFVRWLHGYKRVCVEATQFCMGLHTL